MDSAEGGSLLVVVAEDDATTRKLLERTIAKWGYRPIAVGDGLKAWEVIQALPVHILVTDWDMPGMSGLELCQRIRSSKRDRYTYALMLTHHEDRDRLVQALDAGADDFIPKPFHPRVLQARMKVATRIVNLESELRRSQRRLEKANVQLTHEATTDALTGLGNRRAFDDALARTHALAVDLGLSYGLALLDVDKFKAYNDTYGHQAGDKVLASVGRVLQEMVRGGDDVFRYGGEEIVAVLPRCHFEGLHIVGERLRSCVQTLRINHADSPCGVVTVSVGGAVFDLHESPQPSAEIMVERADKALYEAKHRGRNRVVIHGEDKSE
jgi:two-component system cell cycle response regulator